MSKISILSPDVVAKIAAGEVVERPASIVKELIENSLDAHATHISIDLEAGGTKNIIVRDDGAGMSRQDVELCFLPHTTSKITNEDDLNAIASFGFRGEALASIAAVCNMTIRTRTPDAEAGTLLELEAGKQVHLSPIGIPVGTQVAIESLFYNVPARKKFLKDAKTELKFCIDTISRCALAHSSVGFRLTHDGNILLDLPAGQHQQERIETLLGEDTALPLIPITHESRYGSLTGFLGTPQAAGHFSSTQHIFINNRTIKDSRLTKCIKDSYGSLIEARAHPIFILFLSVPFDQVDVNVHPKKEEVAFAFQDHIESLFREGVQKTLQEHNLTYTRDDAFQKDTSMDWHMATMLKNSVDPWSAKSGLKNGEILQIHNIYLFADVPEGLLIADQHAVHERILFEQFKDAYLIASQQQQSHALAEPYVFDLSVRDAVALSHHKNILEKLGFELEEFGNHSFKLSAVPEFFKNRDFKKLIQEVLYDIEHGKYSGDTHSLDRETERTLAYLACRSAIKAGEALTQDECKNLIQKLLTLQTPYTCPHGRPTHIIVSLRELDRMFKRS